MLRTADKRLFLGRELERILTPHKSFQYDEGSFIAVVASGSANTKGSWTNIKTSSAFDADGFYVQVRPDTASRDWLYDIGIGPAASEVAIITNALASSSGSGSFEGHRYYVPIPVPAGTRFSARCQSTSGSAQMIVGVTPVRGSYFAAKRRLRATTYGAATGDSGGTTIDCGGSASTRGAWAELSSGITNPIDDYALIFYGNRLNGARTATTFISDLGSGAASSEVVEIPGIWTTAEGFQDMVRPSVAEANVRLAAGTRLVMRAECHITDATDRTFDAVVIGFD